MMEFARNIQVVCTVINLCILAFWIVLWFQNRRR